MTGNNGKPLRMPRQAAPMAQSGRLVVPAHVAAERAKEEQAKWKPVFLSWCPEKGPFSVAEGAQATPRPHPLMPPQKGPNGQVVQAHVPWITCPHCGKEHMLASLLAAADEKDPGALGDDDLAPDKTETTSDEQLVEIGGRIGLEARKAFADLAVLHVHQEDIKAAGGWLASLVISALNAELQPCRGAEDDDVTTLTAAIDGCDKADLRTRLMRFVQAMEKSSGAEALFGPMDYCRTLWSQRKESDDSGPKGA